MSTGIYDVTKGLCDIMQIVGQKVDRLADEVQSMKMQIARVRSPFTVVINGKNRTDSTAIMEKVISVVCIQMNIAEKDLIGGLHNHDFSGPRHIAMSLCYEFGVPLARIGKRLHRDHTTVLYGVRKIAQMQVDSADFRRQLDRLRQEINR